MYKLISKIMEKRDNPSPNNFGVKVRSFAYIFAVTTATIFVVYLIAFAANTTIGNNISTSGTLTVGGASVLSSTLKITGDVYASSTLQSTGNALLYGYVGIGATTSPSMELSVQGNGLISGNLTVEGNLKFSGATTLSSASSTLFTVSDTLWVDSKLSVASNTPWGRLSVEMDTTNPSFVVSNQGSSTPAFWIGGVNQNGHIGIGTSTPQQAFSVVGNIENVTDKNFLPRLRGSASTGSGSGPLAVEVSGRYAYVINNTTFTIQVFDVSTSSPALAGSVTTDTYPTAIRVVGRYAYVTSCNNSSCAGTPSFQVFDISNAASPIKLSTVSFGSNAVYALYVAGNYAYVPEHDNDLIRVFDVSNPFSPTSVATVSTQDGPVPVYVFGKYLYVGHFHDGYLQVFSLNNPASPVSVGSVNSGGFTPMAMYVSGRYVYWADEGQSSLAIFDVSNPSSPVFLKYAGTNSMYPVGVFVSGRYAYVVTSSSDSIEVFDVANPKKAYSLGMVYTSSTFNGNVPIGIYVSGRYLYLPTESSNTLEVYDISGLETTSAIIHSLEAGQLQVRNDILAQGLLTVGTGLNVGNAGILSSGPVTVYATTSQSYIFSKLNIFDRVRALASSTVLTLRGFGDEGFLALQGSLPGASNLLIKPKANELSTIFNLKSDLEFRQKSGVTWTANSAWNGPSLTGGGGWSHVVFADLDNDGDYDMLGAEASTIIHAYKNTGSASSPIWTDWPEAHLTFPVSGPYMTLADLDNDGDYDMLAGGDDAVTYFLRAYENTGSPSAPVWTAKTAWNIPGNGLKYAHAAVADLDNDGDYDLLIGNDGATALGYQNTGSPNAPVWTANSAWDITIGGSSYLNSAFADFDNDGDYDVLVGTIGGTIEGYENTGSATSLTWTSRDSWDGPTIGGGITDEIPALADLDNDGDYDLMVGMSDGSVLAYQNTVSDTSFYFGKGGRLGIGTTSPSQLLSVHGNALFSGNITSVVNITATGTLTVRGTASSTFVGAVGVGTTTPDQELTVVGSIENKLPAGLSSACTVSNAAGCDVVKEVGSASTGAGSTPYSVYVVGRYVYLTTNSGTFQIFDVSTSTPALVSSTSLSGGGYIGVYVAGSYAYVANDTGGQLQILDISNPSTPAIIGSMSIPSAVYVQVSGKYAYVLGHNGYLYKIDISNPYKPIQVGSTRTTSTDAYKLQVVGRYAYVSNYGLAATSGLDIFDVSTSSPAKVSFKAATNAVGGARMEGLYVSGDYAYVGYFGTDAFEVIDISNPAAPQTISTTSLGDGGQNPEGIFVAGRYAYVAFADVTPGFQIYDVFNPAQPLMVVSRGTWAGAAPFSVFVSGRYAYLADGNNSLRIFDVSGLETTSAIIHSLEAGQLQVRNDITAYGQLAGSALNIGSGGILSNGPLSISATTSPSSIWGDLAIGTSTPYARLFVSGGSSGTGASVLEVADNASSTLFRILDTGQVGLGTTSPSQTLSVHGNALFSGNLTLANLTATGTVGIGTTSPARLLSVQGGAIVSGDLQVASFKATGTISIGTTTPYAKLSIKATGGSATTLVSVASSSDDVYFEISSTGTTTIEQLQTGVLSFDTNAGAVTWIDMPVTSAAPAGVPMSYSAMVGASSTLTVYAESDGNGGVKNQRVGISTTTPGFTLSVDGNVGLMGCVKSATSTYMTGPANCMDVAEMYIAGEDLEPGDLVALDLNNPLKLIKATSAKNLAGVISTAPAVLFEDSLLLFGGDNRIASFYAADSKVPLTLTGRIPARVNLEGGEIKIGDPITISSESGIGKKAGSFSRIVGYALDNYSGPTPENGGRVLMYAGLSYWMNFDLAQEGEEGNQGNFLALIVDAVKSWLENMKVFIEDGLVRLQNLAAEKITTQLLCVDDVCVNKTQLKALLDNAGLSPVNSPEEGNPPDGGEPAPDEPPAGGGPAPASN